ncbi:LPXTG cell wall anchor domain-containing protein [Arcanobacterium canis]
MNDPHAEVTPKTTPPAQEPSSRLPKTGATVGLMVLISSLMVGTGLVAHRARKSN